MRRQQQANVAMHSLCCVADTRNDEAVIRNQKKEQLQGLLDNMMIKDSNPEELEKAMEKEMLQHLTFGNLDIGIFLKGWAKPVVKFSLPQKCRSRKFFDLRILDLIFLENFSLE